MKIHEYNNNVKTHVKLEHSGQPYYMLNSSDIFSTGLILICLVFYAKLRAFRGRSE